MAIKSTDQFYRELIKNFPVLSPEEELELFRKAKSGDTMAIDKLIKCNLKLVYKFAKKYSSPKLPLADLIQEGNLGVVKAVEKFDPSRRVKFSTYAVRWIEGEILAYIQNQGLIKISDHTHKKIQKLKHVKELLQHELNREPTIEEIAKKMGIKVDDAKVLYQFEYKILAWEGLLDEVEKKDSAQEEPEEELRPILNKQKTLKLLEHFTPKELQILNMELGLMDGEPKNYAQIGRILGLSRARICQMSKQVFNKMQRLMDKESKK